MTSLRRSLVINFFSSSGATIVQFIVSLLLARLLSPSEIGVFSMTIVFVNIAHIFRDFGVATYVQHEPELTPEKLRAANGVLFTSSWLIALLLYIASGWIASWFNEPQMAPVMKVLAIGFIFIPFGSVTHALLTREYAAGKQAIVTVAGTGAYAVTCLGLAGLGFGTMSMAWANLANILACAIAYAPLRPKHLPWSPSFRNWGKVVHFGMGTLMSNCAVAVNNALPDILLGKLGNARLVGLFSRASSTVSIFTYVAGTTVNYGSISYISQAYHRGEAVGPLLNRATALLTGVGWPALALTFVLAQEIITALYGAKWLDAVPAVPALAIAAAISMIFNYTPTALTAIGKPYLSAISMIVVLISRVAFGFVLFDGSMQKFAWAICAATAAALPVMVMQHKKYLGHDFISMLVAILPSALVATACAASAWMLKTILPPMPAIAALSIMALPLALTWYAALRITRHPLVEEIHHLLSGLRARFA
ncbi:oligosaccharide flippase family protein [Noviherbaspirillum pedocola]|uniref:Oligosaccharide flippase family protein n=1 Tax=Noviherbaspirillum pedocola TaxID=2801341 RepID=A0A934SS76_9BURK|nr:oligosaccharide flippase family protein [Noviherbaspirillum pedocola]MBK4734298.1 oligosaccharide flippase family protein [Noviherbaspirillum pedocola]